MKRNIALAFGVSLIGLMSCTPATADLQPFYVDSNDTYFCGYKNDKGEIVIPANKYVGCGSFSDGLAYVGMIKAMKIDGEDSYKSLQGFIDQTGDLIIPIEHEVFEGVVDEYKSFSEGLVVVYKDDKYGYMNKLRELVIPYHYDSAYDFSNGLASVRLDEKYGAIDKNAKVIVPIKFDWLGTYSDGLAMYSESNHWDDGSRYGFIDKLGNIAIKAKWDDANHFSEGFATVRVGDYDSGKWGVIDKLGNYVVKPKYDASAIQTWSDAYDFDDNRYKNGKINMYEYTDPSQPQSSSIKRYTIDTKGKVIEQRFYANWDEVIEKF